MSELNVSRRGMVAGAAAAAAGVGMLAAQAAPSARANEAVLDTEYDVVIVGGGTGLMAALAAAQAGASVAVLEKRGYAGGEMRLSGGVIYAGGTKVQEERGVVDERTGEPDTLEATLADWLKWAAEGVNVELATRIVEMGPSIIDYFVDKGVAFETYQSGLDPVERGHQAGSHLGGELADAILADLDAMGVEVLTDCKATQILTDDDGTIVGVKAKAGDGSLKRFGCKSVVVSTGGPDSNKDLTMLYNPEAIKWLDFGSGLNMGDGFYLVEPLGAARVGQLSWLDVEYPDPALLGVMGDASVKYTQEMFLSYAVPFAQAGPRPIIFVDVNGQRFSDETKGYPAGLGVEIARLDGGFCWAVFSEDLWTVDDGAFPTFLANVAATKESLTEDGVLLQADSIEGIAEVIKVDSAALAQSIEAWNSVVAAGVDDFGRPEQTLMAIEGGPYYAYKITPAYAVPQGGPCLSIDIDSSCRVLDRDGAPIAGLYSSGTGMTFYRAYGRGYPGSGSNLASGFACGRIAGEGAAAFATA